MSNSGHSDSPGLSASPASPGLSPNSNPNPRITDDERRLLDSLEDESFDTSAASDFADPIEMELRRKMLSMLTTSTSQGGPESTKYQPSTRANLLKKHQQQHSTSSSSHTNPNTDIYSSISTSHRNDNRNDSNFINNLNSSNNSVNTSHNPQQGHRDKDYYQTNKMNNNNNNNNTNYGYNYNPQLGDADEFDTHSSSSSVGTGTTTTSVNLNMDTYVTCERFRISKIADENRWDLVAQDCVLKEYRLYAVEEWIFKSSRLWSAIEYTGNQSDQIYVSVVRPTAKSTPTANKQLQNMLSKAPSGSFYTIRTPLGQLVLANSSVSSHFGLNLIPIPNGDFDRHIETLKLNLLLKRLGCTRPRYQLSTQLLIERNSSSSNCYERAKFESLANAAQTNLQTVTNFVKEIQAALSHLNYLPLLTKIDGQYDQKLINAVKAFQTDFNKRNNTSPKDQLQVEGYIDQNTFKGIVTEIMHLRRKIESLGFKTPDNPIKNYIEFNELMKSFQDSYGIYPDAPGKNILTYLENINKNNQLQNQFYYSDDDVDSGSVKSENIADSASSFSETESNDGFNLPSSPIALKNKSVITNISSPTSDTSRNTSPSMISINSNTNVNNSNTASVNFANPINNANANATNNLVAQAQLQPAQQSPISTSPQSIFGTPPHGPQLSKSNKGIPLSDLGGGQQGENNAPFYHDEMYEYFESVEDAEEKQKLKQTIVRLEKLMDTQQNDYNKLKEEFDSLSEKYANMKEQASRSMAIISTNEKIFQEIYHRWGKTIRKELPEIEEKINLNVDTIQSCSNRIKRLEDIVISVQKKNERNIFTIITSSLLSIVSMIAVGFAYLIMFFSGIKRKYYPSSRPKSSSEEIQKFIRQQKIKISELIEDLDYNDQNEDNDKVQ